MNRAFKYRIYPTKEQKTQIHKTIGCCRLMYNQLLDDCNRQLEESKTFKIKKYTDVKKNYDFMSEVSSYALNYSKIALEEAWQRYFKKLGGKPTHHSRYRTNSFTIQNVSNGLRFENGKIRVPSLGLVKGVFHRFCKGKIKAATISVKAGIYEISILTELPDPVKQDLKLENPAVLGIDMAFHGGAVYSDGSSMDMPVFIKNAEKRLKHLQRCLDRKIGQKKGEEKSNNWLKNKQKIDKLQARIARQKKNFLNNESRKIAENYDVAIVEDINLQNMANHKRHGGKSISRINFGMFRTMLQYKFQERNKLYLVADKFFPSSQLCSVCGFQNQDLKNLKIRNWTCPECKTEHDRDINAAINLQKLYEPRLYRGLPVEERTTPAETLDSSTEAGKIGVSKAPNSNLQTYSLTIQKWQKLAFETFLNANKSITCLKTVRKGKA